MMTDGYGTVPDPKPPVTGTEAGCQPETLRELQALLPSTGRYEKVPGVEKLRKSAPPLMTKEWEDDMNIACGLFVFPNGFAVYSADGRETVIRVDRVRKYTYLHADGSSYRIGEEDFGELPWQLALTLVGESRLDNNARRKERRTKHGSEETGTRDAFEDYRGVTPQERLLERVLHRTPIRTMEVLGLTYAQRLPDRRIAEELKLPVREVRETRRRFVRHVRHLAEISGIPYTTRRNKRKENTGT